MKMGGQVPVIVLRRRGSLNNSTNTHTFERLEGVGGRNIKFVREIIR